MKVREIITLEGWKDGSGLSYSTTYADHIVDISAEAISGPMDWSWWEADEMPEEEDTHIIVRLYRPDYDPLFDDDAPLVEWDVWASELAEVSV